MTFYPLMVRLEGRRVLLVGGGRVAARKFGALSAAGASCVVVSPALCPALRERRAAFQWVEARFSPGHLAGMDLAVACTDERAVNEAVRAACAAAGIPVCLCDDRDGSDFIFPSAGRRGGVTVAVSTDGADPGLAKRLKNDWLAALPKDWGQAEDLSGGMKN